MSEQRSDAQKVKDARARLTELENERRYYETLWQSIFDYYPRRVGLDPLTLTKGQKTGSKVYNTTHLNALRLLADGLYGYLVAPSLRWFSLKMPNVVTFPRASAMRQWSGKVGEIPEVKAWLEEVEEVMYSAFLRSNFYDAMPEFFWDGGSIGTATLYSEEDIGQSRIVFSTWHPGEVYIAEDKYGRVDTVYRKSNVKLRNLVQRFGIDKAKQACKIIEMTPTNASQEFEVIHAVYPRADREYGRKDNRALAWESLYICNNELLSESGYRMLPHAVWRYDKNSFEVYGRSPATESIVSVIMMNQVSKDLMTCANLSVFPPVLAPAELRGQVNIKPHGFTYYKDERRPVGPLLPNGEFPVGLDREQYLQGTIERHFMVEFFMMLERAEKVMTATEVLERQGEKAAVMGARIGRLQSEVLNPVIDRVFDIELQAGRLPPPPDLLADLGGQPIEVDYLGPLAIAQKRLFKTQGVISSLQAIAPIIELRPDVADIVDWDEVAREILEVNGMPQNTIRQPDQLAAIRQQRAQQQQSMQMMEEAKLAADAIPKAGKAIEAGSPLQMLLNGPAEGAA